MDWAIQMDIDLTSARLKAYLKKKIKNQEKNHSRSSAALAPPIQGFLAKINIMPYQVAIQEGKVLLYLEGKVSGIT